jgi:hypothetical protein
MLPRLKMERSRMLIQSFCARHGALGGPFFQMPSNEPEHIQEEDLNQFVLGRLAHGKTIAVGSHLFECESCSCRLDEAVEVVRQSGDHKQSAHSQERRRDPRFPANEVVSMHMINPLILERSDVLVLNVSKNGLMLRTSEFVQAGIVVQIRSQTRFVIGEVRYCLPVGNIFQVGIQIQASQRRRVVNGSGSGL